MATQAVGITVQKLPVQQDHGQEATGDDPKKDNAQTGETQLSPDEQKELIELVRKYKQQWYLARRMILKRVLKAHEFFKGNQFISFDPQSFQWFDALESAFSGDNSGADLEMYQFATNFYQMLGFAFVAALSSQVPKTRALPENAEKEEDIATAKAFSTVQEIIERKNQIASLHKQALLELWMSGCYFRHTRYVVDADAAGTHKEPALEISQQVMMPARYSCSSCAATTPAQGQQQNCANCGQPLSDQDYFPEEKMEIPIAQEFKEVANGMVTMDIYGPMHVDVHPRAGDLTETPILNLDVEVSVGVLRSMYPGKWNEIRKETGGLSQDSTQEKQSRSIIFSEGTSAAALTQEQLPTYSRTWIQPWAFNDIDDQAKVKKYNEWFPDGVLLCNIGDTFLDAQPAKLTKEWTHCGTVKKKFGMFPPAVGDAAIPVQERINDTGNITHEYMDRLAGGIILVNQDGIDTNSMSGKPLLPGTMNPVKLPKAMQTSKLSDQIVQIKCELDNNIYNYTDKLVFWMQLLVGTPPQIFGGAGDPHIETAAGQQQQLSTAMGKLGGFWDECRDENAKAAELAVNCAAENMNDDWFDVVTDSSGQFRNEYVFLDDMRGSIHAYPETDQGFPMTHAEISAWWQQLIEYASSGKNPLANAILDEPANQEQMAIWTGVPGLVVPGKEMRNKVMQIIDRLMKESPQQTMAPVPNPADPTGQSQIMQPITMPSIQPDPLVDDMEIIIQVVKEWSYKNWMTADEDPEHWANVMGYLKLAVSFQQKDQMAQMQLEAQTGGKPGAASNGQEE
jgi:hypothetical protein